MAIINRGTLQQKITDFINRVSPFTTPLIQQSEDLEVRTDVLDSVIFKIPTIGSISSPAATFTADFATNDEININSAASIAASFNVTLANLRGNSIGKLNITKKINDVFNFANGQIINADAVAGQTGKTVLKLLVINTDAGYFVIPAYEYKITENQLADNSVGQNQMLSNSIGTPELIDQSVNQEKIFLFDFSTALVRPGYSSAGFNGEQGLRSRLNVLNQVEIIGFVWNANTNLNIGSDVLHFATLPSFQRPTKKRYVVGQDYGGNPTSIEVNPDGRLRSANFTNPGSTNPNANNGLYMECVIPLI